ncbi:substrate-binding periplasmic protein [Roseibium sp.]|uniref:substrate-binding periplasmic protein n=1 Tax=Roseibium sp. TaxID=1936156 RepID=UPI003B51B0E6
MVKGQSFQLIVFLAGLVWVLGAPGQAASRIDIVTENYPPYEMAEPDNGLRGFDYEVAVEAFRRMGYHADIRFLPWKRALSEAENGTTSGILTCAFLEERERFILYSDPISSFTDGLFLRSAHAGPEITKLDDVIGQPVASMAGYESLQVLRNIGADPIEAQTTEIGLRMLAAGRFDYLLGAREQIEYTIRQEGLTGQFEFITLTTKDFHFCFSRNFPGVEDLVEHFNAALAEMREDGTYDAIHGKYR